MPPRDTHERSLVSIRAHIERTRSIVSIRDTHVRSLVSIPAHIERTRSHTSAYRRDIASASREFLYKF